MTQDKTDERQDNHQAAGSHSSNSAQHREIGAQSNIASDLEALRLESASSTGTLGGSLAAVDTSTDTDISARPRSTQLARGNLTELQTGSSRNAFGSESSPQLLGTECKALELNAQGDTEGSQKTAGSDETKLSPDSFNSLTEAFRSSLHVIRSLRTAVSLLSGAEGGDEIHGNRKDDQQQSVLPDAAVTAAKLIASQEAFVAEEVAYGGLLREAASGPPVLRAGASSTPREKSAAAATAAHEAAATGASLVAEGFPKDLAPLSGDVLPAEKGSTDHLTTASAGNINGPKALEYELSVCKALLLLQQLAPSSLTTTEELLVPSCPPLATSLLFDRPTSGLEKKARTELPAHKSEAASKVLLDALLRVRLLQGTQQLLRADFLKLLHEQRQEHQQLHQAVQITVAKLGTFCSVVHLCVCIKIREKTSNSFNFLGS
ncbi:hypothetical protein ACSSS7_000535 [Eimeria intestinalis]